MKPAWCRVEAINLSIKILVLVISLIYLTYIYSLSALASAGDKAIYRDTNGTFDTNNTSMTGVPFNSQQQQDTPYTQNANDIDVDLDETAHYLYGYVVQSRNDAYGKEMNFISRTTLNAVEEATGHGSGYRNDRTNDRYYAYGYGLIDATSGDDIRVEVQRQGSNSSSHLLEADRSSLWILQLDETWDYLRLRGADNQSTSTSLQEINFNSSLENTDTNVFGHSTGTNPNQITLKETGHYMVIYNVGVDSASDYTSITSNLELNGTDVEQSYDYAFANSSMDGNTSNMTIIEATANDILTLEWAATGATANSTQTISGRTAISIIRMPDTGEYLRVHETTDGQDVGGLDNIITFDTQDESDSGSFSFSTVTGRVTIQDAADYLFTAGARSNRTTSKTELTSGGAFYVNATRQTVGNTGMYVWGANTPNVMDGGWSGAGIFSLSASDIIDFRQIAEGGAGGDDTFQSDMYGMTAVNLDGLFIAGNEAPEAPLVLYANNDNAQSGQASPATGISDATPAFSAEFHDPNVTDTAIYYQLQVGDDTDWSDAAELWDSTKTSMTSCSENNRCTDITYAGTALSSATSYYWRIKYWDNSDLEGSWSSTAQFTTSNPAAAGDISIYSDTNGTFDTENATYTGVPFNNQIRQDTTFTQNANDIDVDLATTGHYVYGYMIQARNDTLNKPVSYQTRITVGGAEELLGHGQGYHADSGDDMFHSYGYGMTSVTSGEDIRVEVVRQGSNTGANLLEANRSSLWLLKLPDTYNYLRLQGQDNQSTSASIQDINFTTLVENTDTNVFGHSTGTNPNEITLKEAGHYLVTYVIGVDSGTDETSITSNLAINGTQVPESFDYSFIEGGNGDTEGITTNMTIIEAEADDVLKAQWGATGAGAVNGTQTVSSMTGIGIVKLDDRADFLRVHESTTPQDIGGLNSTFTFDTEDEEDTGSFSYVPATGVTTVQATGDYLFTSGGRSTKSTGATNLMTAGNFYVGGTRQSVGGTGMYVEGISGGGTGSYDGGWSAAGVFELTSSNTVDFRQVDEGDNGDADQMQIDSFGITALNINSLFTTGPGIPATPYTNNTTAQFGVVSPAIGLTDLTPAFSAIFTDTDTGESAVFYQLEVGDDTDWSDAAELWDSTKTAITSCNEGDRCSDIIYAGSTLSSGNTYYWRIKYWNSSGTEGPWSLNQSFSINAPPTVNNVSVNGGSNISLTENTSTSISWTANIVDSNGYTDIASASGKLYRSGATGGSSCSLDNSNCYEDSSCVLSACSGSSCVATCTADIEFFADPTDAASPYPTEYWLGYIVASDNQAESGNATSPTGTTEMSSLLALSATSLINFGSLSVNQDTGSNNELSSVTNTGNRSIDVNISGDDMCTDYPTCSPSGSPISVSQMQYSTTGFTYGSGISLSSTPTKVDLNLIKSTVSPSNSTSDIYWGIAIPTGIDQGDYFGSNIFTAITDT